MIQSIEDGRKEDGNRSIADKIIKRLHDLDKTVENNYGRWAWELLQNAKDSISDDEDRSVSVQIELNKESVEFRHNGTHFSEKDIRGLINQISSKELEEGQLKNKAGKFGTGFLTTHLLTRVIQIKGIIETQDSGFHSFEFPIDRDSKTTPLLVPKIENAWREFHKSAKKISSNYDKDLFNTSFRYILVSKEQKEIAKIGVEEFIKLVPFVLAFIPKIDCVEILDKTSNNNILFRRSKEIIDNSIIQIQKTVNKKDKTILILFASDEKVSIATEVEKTEKGYLVKSNKDIPKLFCDFPLIGTENFYFPIIVNSFYFNPQTERDGIWLKGSQDKEVAENQEILEKALDLYKNLISDISSKAFFDLFNIAETKLPLTNEKYFDEKWFRDNIQKPLRESIINTNLVELEDDITEKKSIKDLWFPTKSYSDSDQLKLWQFTFDLVPKAVCKKAHALKWSDLSWENWQKLNFTVLASTVSKKENIENLSETMELDVNKTLDWLNSFCNFLLSEESNLSLFEKHPLIPNQKGIFIKKSELRIDEIEDKTLIDILALLGEDWKKILLNKNINFGTYNIKSKKDIASVITEKLKGPINLTDNTIKAISLLSEWFEKNKETGKELFSELYKKRAELFMNTITDKENLYKVMRSKTDLAQLSKVAQAIDENPKLLDSLKKAEELSNLLKEFKVSDVAELKKMLLVAQGISVVNQKNEITQDVLASLGVSSIEELEEALKDKDLALLFNHTSTPNVEMFKFAQSLISRAKKNILKHIKALPEYDCTEMEELATTVYGGIKKNGLSMHIVVRPSDNGEVIVYYSSEKDTLDYENAELWIDNGIDKPRHLTLGKILKTTGINKIPV